MTVSITTRADKGAALTFNEVDGNFTALKNAVEELQETPIVISALPPTDADGRPDGTIYIQTA